MARIKIELPKDFIFSYTMPVRITDLNYGSHVGNDTYLSYLQEARMAWLAGMGYTELEFAGTGLIMSNAMIEYKKELRYNHIITIKLQPTDATKYGFDLYYKILIQNNSETIAAAYAMTTMLCYDYASKKLALIPQEALSNIFPKDAYFCK